MLLVYQAEAETTGPVTETAAAKEVQALAKGATAGFVSEATEAAGCSAAALDDVCRQVPTWTA